MVVARAIKIVSVTKFARGLTADTTVYLGFIEATIEQLDFMYRAAHGTESQEAGIGDEHSERLLDDIEVSFPSVFMEPTYPVW